MLFQLHKLVTIQNLLPFSKHFLSDQSGAAELPSCHPKQSGITPQRVYLPSRTYIFGVVMIQHRSRLIRFLNSLLARFKVNYSLRRFSISTLSGCTPSRELWAYNFAIGVAVRMVRTTGTETNLCLLYQLAEKLQTAVYPQAVENYRPARRRKFSIYARRRSSDCFIL